LARQKTNYLTIADIAKNENISVKFLESIIAFAPFRFWVLRKGKAEDIT
jgi:hypothetical protein